MAVTVRFAPSPTGLLHVGNARIALVNWLFAQREEGRLVLRLDDTDIERSTPEFATAIEEDLAWLGLVWNQRVRQSERLDRYHAAAERLRASGRLYPCYETEEELAAKREAMRARGLPPIYDRAALDLDAAGRARLEAEGRRPHWRFRVSAEALSWSDIVHGPLRFEGAKLADPVLVRSDGEPLYLLTSVVDDIELSISHVIRGDDHIANTAAQIDLFRALGEREPRFAHLPLLTDEAGQGLSKRLGALSLRGLRDHGIRPMAINLYLARLGTGRPIEPAASLDALVAEFDLTAFSPSPAKFQMVELRHLNDRLFRHLPFSEAADLLAALGMSKADERFWSIVKTTVSDWDLQGPAELRGWYEVCFGELDAAVDIDLDFTRVAGELLPPEPWNGDTWRHWTERIKARTGRTGKELFGPLRLALTHRAHGPEMRNLLPLIGRDRALARLHGKPA
jgi:glutamyl-tRNA synthetase